MYISREDIMEAVLTNNTERVVEILELFGLTKTNDPPYLTPENQDLVRVMLRFASVLDKEGDVDYELADALIESTAMTVDLFSFLQIIAVSADFVAMPRDIIPAKLCAALEKGLYTDDMSGAIASMEVEEFEALITFIMSESVNIIDVRLNKVIIQCAYAFDFLPNGMLWAYMGLCPRKATREALPAIGIVLL